jgi:hypothetical protein
MRQARRECAAIKIEERLVSRLRLRAPRAGRGMGAVLLGEKDFEPWLSRSAGLELLKPAANYLRSE